MKKIVSALVGLTLAGSVFAGELSENPSEASLISVVVAASAVYVFSVEPSDAASTAVSKLLSSDKEWRVERLEEHGDKTKVVFVDTQRDAHMTAEVPTAVVKSRHVMAQDKVTLRKLGKSSFAVEERDGRPFTVLLVPDSGLEHSAARK